MRWRARWQRTAVGTSARWVASAPRGDGTEKVGNAHHGGLNHDLQDVADLALGRREFFGLLAWRTVTTVAGCILVGQLADGARGDGDPPPVAHNCTYSSPNTCDTPTPNECTTALGSNTCSGGPTGQTANSCIHPPGGNSCRSTTTTGINTCQGPTGGYINSCTGPATANQCLGTAGANTCDGKSGGFANVCQGQGANVCEPAAANACLPASANQILAPDQGPPPGGN